MLNSGVFNPEVETNKFEELLFNISKVNIRKDFEKS